MKAFLPLFFFVFTTMYLTAQPLNGRVTDMTKMPIAGAYVIHLQSEHHAHTNEDGYFLLYDVLPGDTLQVIHLGYETTLIKVKEPLDDVRIQLKENIFLLDDIVVGQNIKSVNIISNIDTKTSPVNSSQEILRKVPGLFIGQHAGGGKAEQIFLRGFDIDHGTDISITVDGMPVNMVSHAHGQGYADMHFIIPETIDKVDFGKGPYYADKGNFATAGYVALKTKERLDNSFVSLEAGRFNSFRTFGGLNVLNTDNHNAYIAAEQLLSDGPFESSQNFKRTNIMAKYTGRMPNKDRISIIASHFSSQWDASGQIPQRAVDAGLISRFGAIDDTEGGSTSRTNVSLSFNRNLNDQTFIKNTVFYSHYDFELFSNFTFFLEDPINRDQIVQREDRNLFGLESEWNHYLSNDRFSTLLQGGVGFRYDDIDGNELSRTKNRKTTLERLQLGDVDENNLYLYSNAELDFGAWLLQAGVRLDHFKFNYVDQLDSLYSTQSTSKALVSPKINLIFNATDNAQFFFKSGMGFHSNDSRVILSGESDDIIPAAYGADLGGIFKPIPKLIVNTALWYLFSEQEFVYVGDAGIVEPSGQSRRLGADLGIRWQLSNALFASGDITYTIARSVNEPENANYIPLAPFITATGGLNYKLENFSTGISFRYMDDRPANEDYSITALSYFITDLNANYQWKNIGIGFSIENLFNQEWNETQFATESRLQNEPESVTEIHFTPGTPFFIKGNFNYKF